jgi:glutamate racemase
MSRAIGVFDSGVGGLTVLRELRRALPRESTIYLGDSARMPYGGLLIETIRRYTLEGLDYLRDQGVKALVLACNSATSAALEAARARYDLPVVGVIEATARGVALSGSTRVGVVGTEATVSGGQYLKAIASYRPDVEVLQQACPRLADLVERGETRGLRVELLLESCLRPLKDREVETLVLGCTHYGFLRSSIQRLMGPEVKVVECGPSVASAIAVLIEEGAIERGNEESPSHRLLTTGPAWSFGRAAAILWPDEQPEIETVTVGMDNDKFRRQAA